MSNPNAAASLPDTIASLGQVMQLAFVPADFDAALRFWTGTMGAGPFYLMEHIRAENCKYRDEPADIDFTAAVGYWGDIQIELIKQHNDTPSIYSTWREQGLEGLHHVCIAVEDMQHAREVCAAAGATVLQEAQFRGGSAEVIYVDTNGGPGTMVELWKGDAAGRAFFASVREAARDWDGSNPVRKRS
ncbi:VOC family protein [Massilia niastensis]|uniref:VOC family protein n=1 Tax=Massilia niastensis TaxID=544911 RepID=UPI000368A69A|nr:VOC family protein [Massilia niastensis]